MYIVYIDSVPNFLLRRYLYKSNKYYDLPTISRQEYHLLLLIFLNSYQKYTDFIVLVYIKTSRF